MTKEKSRLIMRVIVSAWVAVFAIVVTAAVPSVPDGTRARWMSGKYGLMVHWLAPAYTGDEETVDAPVESFDIKGFLEDFDASGAAWLIFTIGQNRGTYASPNAGRGVNL